MSFRGHLPHQRKQGNCPFVQERRLGQSQELAPRRKGRRRKKSRENERTGTIPLVNRKGRQKKISWKPGATIRKMPDSNIEEKLQMREPKASQEPDKREFGYYPEERVINLLT